MPNTALSVFFSYAHEDEGLRDKLAKHLTVMQRQGVIESWHDRGISAGSEWAGQIDEQLERADIILLLVSDDFLASDYCWGIEVKRAMARHETGGARVIPVILRDVDWHEAPFGKLQALPKDGRPVEGRNWHSKDEAFTDIARGIQRVVKELRAQRQRADRRPGAGTHSAEPDKVPDHESGTSRQNKPPDRRFAPQWLLPTLGVSVLVLAAFVVLWKLQPTEDPPDSATIEAGRALFIGRLGCYGCHGQKGDGGMGPSLADDNWIYGGDEASILETLRNGRPNGMPAFGAQATGQELQQVTAYVRSLSASAR